MKVEIKKMNVAMADSVIALIVKMAIDRYNVEMDVEWVSYNLYANPRWTSGDAVYTLINKDVFVNAVINAMIETNPDVMAWNIPPIASQYAPSIPADLIAVVG